VQAAQDGALRENGRACRAVIAPLYAAYGSAARAREARATARPRPAGAADRADEDGKVASVAFKDRLDAHRLIEEFMVLANVAAAETLIAKARPLLYRVHEEPQPEKIEALRETAQAAGFTLAKGQVLQTAAEPAAAAGGGHRA
jgi:ribonuclease R